MNMDTIALMYNMYKNESISSSEDKQHIFIQDSKPLSNKILNKKKPTVFFKQKDIDLNQTLLHTIENIGIN